jgi:hypothetical protein
LIADTQAHLREQSVDPHLLDETAQAVPRAQLRKARVLVDRLNPRAPFGLLSRGQSLDFCLGDPMVAALGPGRSDRAVEHPPFQR